jgi:hypothetical protein
MTTKKKKKKKKEEEEEEEDEEAEEAEEEEEEELQILSSFDTKADYRKWWIEHLDGMKRQEFQNKLFNKNQGAQEILSDQGNNRQPEK